MTRSPLRFGSERDTSRTMGPSLRFSSGFGVRRGDAHATGGELRWRSPWSLELSAEGGRTFPLFTDTVTGFFAGGGLGFSAGPLSMQARGQVRKDPYFDWRRLWVGIELTP